MKIKALKFVIFGSIWCSCSIASNAQSPNEVSPRISAANQASWENACRLIQIKEDRSYSFRALPQPPILRGAAAPPKWYEKLFPFLRRKPKLTGDMEAIQKTLTHPLPLGETKRSQKVRAAAEAKLRELEKDSENKWQAWLAANPNALSDEKQTAEGRIRSQGLAATRLARFDWRHQGLNVGEVGFQGFECNNCWAFMAVDAMQASRRLSAMRAGRTDFDESLSPSVQQLVSCMSQDKKTYCGSGWHGKAFSYLLEKGLPLGGPTYYDELDAPLWSCESETFVKALTWDYVSRDPTKISTEEEIKLALVRYGPVVTSMRYDSCLWLYGDGVFNGENPNKPTHFVLIIGWDDAKKAWLIKNSYGAEWGDKGFGWIKYRSNGIGRASAWIMADPKEEERIARESRGVEK